VTRAAARSAEIVWAVRVTDTVDASSARL